MTDKVLTRVHDGVVVITINRPEVRNAVDKEVSEQVAASIDQLEANSNLRLGILTGAGGFFSAGMDFQAFLRGEDIKLPGRGVLGITESPPRKPLIAAVEGFALGGGLEIALACDLVVAARNARFGLPEVKRGLAATAGGLLRLPRLIPQRIAMEMALTGDALDATVLHHHGLINRLTDPGGALLGALQMAKSIVSNAPLAVSASKRVIAEQQDWSQAERFSRQEEITKTVRESDDAREGASAFTSKRLPVWRGK